MRSPFVLLLVIAAACGAPRDAEIRTARVRAEGKNLGETFDRLEDRLLANQARVRLWRELRERHESVAAIACASQEEHAAAMAAHQLPAHSQLHRAKVAAATAEQSAPARARPRAIASE